MNNPSYYIDNQSYYNSLQAKYENLKELKLYNNIFYYLEYTLDLQNFDLHKIPEKAFLLYPYDLLNIIKINIDIENELAYLEKEEYNLNYLYMKIRTILVKNVISGIDEYDLNKFIDAYLVLRKYQDFLTPVSMKKFQMMAGVIRDNLYNGEISTPGITIIKEKLDADNGRNHNNISLKLTNPNYKGYSEDDALLSKTGYISIITILLYVIANIGFVIATLLLKK